MKTCNPSATIDFSTSRGKLRRELTSTNFAPVLQSRLSLTEEYKALRSYSTRTNYLGLTNRGQRSFDVHFLFPLQHLDAYDPVNYYFAPTDYVMNHAFQCGTGIFYTLGSSPENNLPGHNYNSEVPKDYSHYADICAQIIRHFTQNWNDGHTWDIPYFEIWNAPDAGPNCWLGTRKQFLDFYVVMLRQLKQTFPNLKFGGPSLASLDSPWTRPLLKRLKEENLTPDFFSFHCYTDSLDDIKKMPAKARRILDSYGMTKTEVFITEWHYLPQSLDRSTPEAFQENVAGPLGIHGITAAAFLASTLIHWHDAPIDQAFFFGAGCCEIKTNVSDFGFVNHLGLLNKNYHALKAICDIINDTPKRVQVTSSEASISILAGTNATNHKCQIVLSDYMPNSHKDIILAISGMSSLKNARILRWSNLKDAEEIPVVFHNGVLTLPRDYQYSAVFQIQFEK